MSESTLLIRLVGPLQSWGSCSKFDYRDTDAYPTKSGIIGMIASAMGRKRGEDISDLVALKFGVRIDLPGKRLCDLQSTRMRGDPKRPKLKGHLAKKIYLTDAKFLVGLEGNKEFLQTIEEALRAPKYHIYLGRRCCVPGLPVAIGVKDSYLYEALYQEEWLVPDWWQKDILAKKGYARLRIIVEDNENGVLRKDLPITFSMDKRIYGYRGETEMPSKIIKSEEDKKQQQPAKWEEHDIFSFV